MPETLKFHFTPTDPAKEGETNPLARTTTYLPEVVEKLKQAFSQDVLEVSTYAGEHTVIVSCKRIRDICTYLKEELGFNYLTEIAGNDRFTEQDRFEVVYNLVALSKRMRLRVKVRVDEEHPEVDTVSDIWRAANWHERECWDMLGIRFKGHPDPRRIFMPEDFEHYPLRKEFPPLGIPGSLPIPSSSSDGQIVADPFAAAHREKKKA